MGTALCKAKLGHCRALARCVGVLPHAGRWRLAGAAAGLAEGPPCPTRRHARRTHPDPTHRRRIFPPSAPGAPRRTRSAAAGRRNRQRAKTPISLFWRFFFGANARRGARAPLRAAVRVACARVEASSPLNCPGVKGRTRGARARGGGRWPDSALAAYQDATPGGAACTRARCVAPRAPPHAPTPPHTPNAPHCGSAVPHGARGAFPP